jgi:hypothetical protein
LIALAAVVLLVGKAEEENVPAQVSGLLGGSKSCDDLDLNQVGTDYRELSEGLGLAFAPTAKALERCGFLDGRSKAEIRSVFGRPKDYDQNADSWNIGVSPGVMGPEKNRYMTVRYSSDDEVIGVEVS